MVLYTLTLTLEVRVSQLHRQETWETEEPSTTKKMEKKGAKSATEVDTLQMTARVHAGTAKNLDIETGTAQI